MKSDEHQNILKIKRTARNKTITLSKQEINEYGKKLLKVSNLVSAKEIENKIINSDLFEAEKHLPDSFVNLLFYIQSDCPSRIYKKQRPR